MGQTSRGLAPAHLRFEVHAASDLNTRSLRSGRATIAHVRRTKQYESKIAALQAINSALQKENDKLRKQAARDDDSDAGT